MRILHCCNAFLKTGGIQTVVRLLDAGLTNDEHVSAVLTTAHKVVNGSKQPDGIYTLMHQAHTDPWISAVKRLLRAGTNKRIVENVLDQFKPDIVHLHLGPLLDDAFGLLTDQHLPILVTIHSPISNRSFSHDQERQFIDWLVRRADQVSCVSKSVANSVDDFVTRPNESIVIYNGVPIDPLPVKKKRKSDQLIFIGRLWPQKGPDILIQAVSMIKGIKLWVAGDGPLMSELKKMVIQLDLNNVTFLGDIGRAKLCELMAQSAALVIPSRTEGLGMVALEAMSCGCPVIACNVGGLSEIIIEGLNGLLVPPENPQALATAIKTLLGDRDLQLALSERALRHVRMNYSISKMTEAYLDIYRYLLR